MLIGNFLTQEERQLAGLTQVEARVTGRPDPDAPLKQWRDEGPRPARVDTPDPKLCPNIASIKQRTSPPATDTQRSLRSERGTPRSAPMHYLRTHAGQAWQTGRTGGRQAEEALPGWACLGRIRAVGGIYLEKGGRLTRISTDPLLAAELERTPCYRQ